MIFYSWKRLSPSFFKKIKKYDRVNIIYFWKGQVQPESVTASKKKKKKKKKQQRRHQSFIFVQAKNFGYSWIFLEESFPDK